MWLQTESRLAQLEIWVGFAKYVLALGTITGLIVFLGNKPPETLSYLVRVIGAIISLASIVGGIGFAVHKYRKRNRHGSH
jgi:hypothetical protein